MPSFFPNAVTVYMSTGTVNSWIDISNRVLSDIDAELGMTDESYENRTADPASLFLNLKNSDGAMSPSINFGKGTKLKIDVSYGLFTKTKFYGVIDEADIDVG